MSDGSLRQPPTSLWMDPVPGRPGVDALDREMNRLLDFAEGSVVVGGGFGYLGNDGLVRADRPLETWISGRMTYCFALGALAGRESCKELVDHGLAALLPGAVLHDDANGGWYAAAPHNIGLRIARRSRYRADC